MFPLVPLAMVGGAIYVAKKFLGTTPTPTAAPIVNVQVKTPQAAPIASYTAQPQAADTGAGYTSGTGSGGGPVPEPKSTNPVAATNPVPSESVQSTSKAVADKSVIPTNARMNPAAAATGTVVPVTGAIADAAHAASNQALGTMAAIANINPGPTPAPAPVKKRIVAPHGEFGNEQARSYAIHNIRRNQKSVEYELGESTMSGILPTIVWSGDVDDYLKSTNDQMRALDNDIAHASLPADFTNAWQFFKTDWDHFYAKESDTTHFLGAAGTMDQIDVYVEKMKQYQLKMQQLGAAKNVPGIVEDPNSIFQVDETTILGKNSSLKAAGIGAGLVVVAIVGIKVLVPRI